MPGWLDCFSLRRALVVVYCFSLSACTVFEDGERGSKAPAEQSPLEDISTDNYSSDRELLSLLRARPGWLSRGEHLIETVAACGSCHGVNPLHSKSPLTGSVVITAEGKEILAPNITSDPAQGIGAWSLSEIVDAIRSSARRDGSEFSADVHQGYRWMSDRDALSIAVALRSSKPQPAGASEFSEREENLLELPELFGDADFVRGYVAQSPETDSAGYGYYLARSVANCQRCHRGVDGWFSEGEEFAGSARDDRSGPGIVSGPDIRGGKNSKLADWSIDDYVSYLSSGKRLLNDSSKAEPTFCPVPYYAGMTSLEKKAIARYLKGL